eukprot:RCo048221
MNVLKKVKGGSYATLLPDSLPPREALLHLAIAHHGFHVIGALTRLGIPDLLGGCSRTAPAVAVAIRADTSAVFRLLRAAVAVGVLQIDPKSALTAAAEDPVAGTLFTLTQTGEVLRRGAPNSMRAFAVGEGSRRR